MGSHTYTFRVRNLTLFAGGWPPNELLAVFQEEDRNDHPQSGSSSGEKNEAYQYQCPVGHLIDRLEIMGFTLALAREQMDSLRTDALSTPTLRIRRRNESSEDAAKRESKTATLTKSSFEDWLEAYVRLTDAWLGGTFYESRATGPLDGHLYLFLMEESDAPVEGIRDPFKELRFKLRAMLAVFRRDEPATLDFTPMIKVWDQSPTERLTEAATESLLAPARATEPIVVLTEGRTDTRILSRSMERLYPHLSHLYTFLDHEGFGPPPGTGNIGNLLKGLAGCRISNRVIALFDNDAAGMVAVNLARKRNFPRNFRVLQLPVLEHAKSYPTLGPTGLVSTDINGSACGIELYLGRMALSGDDGALMPIQWTVYQRQLEKYQGELRDKGYVQEKYLKTLEASERPATDPQFDDMRAIFCMIFDAFAQP